MNGLPDHDPELDLTTPIEPEVPEGMHNSAEEPGLEEGAASPAAEEAGHSIIHSEGAERPSELLAVPDASQDALFESYYGPEMRSPVRIPHLGHLAILGAFGLFGLLCAGLLIRLALKFDVYGITNTQTAITDIHYTLGSEAVLYLFTFIPCIIFFPMIWGKGFFAGLQWNGGIALQLRRRLFIIASVCFALALINGILLPGPTDAPIDKIFRAPGAAWLLFGFGVTIAPFFEEMVFRGFLLPALCTACDWIHEKVAGAPVRPLDENGQPQWSFTAMVIASIATSLPFAGMHAAQTGYSWGPFVLLVGVSLVLCWARLSTRSLAASTMVHASYNFLLFFLMMVGTEGFRHLDKM